MLNVKNRKSNKLITMYIGFPTQPSKNLKGPTAYFSSTSSGLPEMKQHYHYQSHRRGPYHCFLKLTELSEV